MDNYGVFDLQLLATAKKYSLQVYDRDIFSAWPDFPLLPEDSALWPQFGLEFVLASMRPDAAAVAAAAAAGGVELGENFCHL